MSVDTRPAHRVGMAAVIGAWIGLLLVFKRCPGAHPDFMLKVINQTNHDVADLVVSTNDRSVVQDVPSIPPHGSVDVRVHVGASIEGGLVINQRIRGIERPFAGCMGSNLVEHHFELTITPAGMGEVQSCFPF